MSVEANVAEYYTSGALEGAILGALQKAGIADLDHLSPDDLSGADEFHLEWRAATLELARDMKLSATMHVLDIGAGIGGPARQFATVTGAKVTGIDLTEEFVTVANSLSARCGLSGQLDFVQASGTSMPFGDGSFDAAVVIHVGMNVPDKLALFREAFRVLKLGGLFIVYDIVRTGEAELSYPMPWARDASTSFVERLEDYRSALGAAGFQVEAEDDKSALALRLGREMREKAARDGAPPVGLHLLLGPPTQQSLGNVMKALADGIIAPVAIFARRG